MYNSGQKDQIRASKLKHNQNNQSIIKELMLITIIVIVTYVDQLITVVQCKKTV